MKEVQILYAENKPQLLWSASSASQLVAILYLDLSLHLISLTNQPIQFIVIYSIQLQF